MYMKAWLIRSIQIAGFATGGGQPRSTMTSLVCRERMKDRQVMMLGKLGL
jgi:hypothetical protein